MFFLATTKIRQIKMADPNMLTAHTRGSARSVFFRHRRVVAAPMSTPNRPVMHVIAPKIRLDERGGQKKYYRCSSVLGPKFELSISTFVFHLSVLLQISLLSHGSAVAVFCTT